MKVEINIGEKLFDFLSHHDWVNNAKDRFAQYGVHDWDVILLDADMRVCKNGAHFRIADQQGTFPISVHRLRPPIPASHF